MLGISFFLSRLEFETPNELLDILWRPSREPTPLFQRASSSVCMNSPRVHADAPRQQRQAKTRADRLKWLQVHGKQEALERLRPVALIVSRADANRPHRRLRTNCRYRLRGRVPRLHVHAYQAVVN